MDARTGIEQALLDRIGKIQKDWEEREARLTGLVENLNSNLEGLSGNQQILNRQLNGLDQRLQILETELQSWHGLAEQLESLSRQFKDG